MTIERARAGGDPAAAGGPVMAQRLRAALNFAIGAGMLALAIWVLRRWAAHVSVDDLMAELAQIAPTNVLLAILFSFASFVALFGYEYYACQFIGRPITWVRAGIISFITQSIAHAVGFAIFVGATVRYKLYSSIGLNLFEVAKIQVFFTVTFGLGCLVLGGGTLLIEPYVLGRATGLDETWWRLLGLSLLAIVAAVLIWGTWFHRPIRVGGQVFVLPSARITLLQIALGVTDLAFVAGALHVLLPADLGLDYFETLGVFVAAITLGLISHVPGSLGVFESAVLVLVDPQPEQTAAVIGALIMFRACYYMLPLLLGATLFGVLEARRWLAAARPASEGRS
ncbi:MAG: hypothetical protein NZ555_02160 [Geminicoccaceae bacterium]|nr:hypothetical protein [Geminicoccaceae bacterium]MCX8101150.1 hypothetical protein [Geminicoccaceae bacterium]MDW8370134.1 hypothetical protein [Geminicoccaceae bacterium]